MSEGYEVERKLLQALKDNPDRYLDERALVEQFGLGELMHGATESAEDIQRAVEILRLQGYEIDGDGTRGWMLIGLPERISRFELEDELSTTYFGQCLFTYRVIGSTNQTARTLAAGGVPDGALLVAEEQTGGRGRRGAGWYSPSGGGIWASLVLRPGLEGRRTGSLGMLAGLCICLGIEERTGLKPSIKWPNDLFLDGRKLGGVLCEAEWRGRELAHVVLGFGINVNIETFPPELAGRAISLMQAAGGQRLHRTTLLASILDRLEEGYFHFLADGFASFLPRVQVRDFLKGRDVTIEFEDGGRVQGVARGIDENGALLVEQPGEDRLRAVNSGHVTNF